MFDKEFYPTPLHVLDMMQIDSNNKIVLEPSAGKGDIVDYVKNQGCKKVLAYETNKDLRAILKDKCTLLGEDFLKAKAEDVSHINMIVMNPPFSNADKHIEHAFNIAPEGCEIIALCNYETINKSFRYRGLASIVKNYGVHENLGSCFDTAERKTNVEIGLVRLFKPMVNESNDFEGFYFDLDEERTQGEGIMQYDEVYALVQRYIGAIKCFDKLSSLKAELEYTLKPIGVDRIEVSLGYSENIANKIEFSKMIQKKSWKHIFNKMNLSKYVTSGVMQDINKFVEQQEKYPFTVKNVYRMFEIIVGTRQQTMNRALEEVIDNFTRHTHENRFGVEGWKTNSGHMLNKKFIVEGLVEPSWGDNSILKVKYNYRNTDRTDDLTKVLCNIMGQNYNDIGSLHSHCNNLTIERGQWYEWGFFEFKAFTKGTVHFKFKNVEDWYRLNKAYGELKGFVLSEQYKK